MYLSVTVLIRMNIHTFYSYEQDQDIIIIIMSAMITRKQIRMGRSKVGGWMSSGGEKVPHYNNVTHSQQNN